MQNSITHPQSIREVLQIALGDISDLDDYSKWEIVSSKDLLALLEMARRGGYIPNSIAQIPGTDKAQIRLLSVDGKIAATIVSNDIGSVTEGLPYTLAISSMPTASLPQPSPLEAQLLALKGNDYISEDNRYTTGKIVKNPEQSDGYIIICRKGREVGNIRIIDRRPLKTERGMLPIFFN